MYDIIKKEIRFERDENKNKINIRKHGISFNEAISAFLDNNSVLFDDPEHSYDEERYFIIGMSNKARLCIVSHCLKNEDTIRIISARKAAKKEEEFYSYEKNKRRN